MVVGRLAAVPLAIGLLTGCAVRSHLMSPTGESPTALRPLPGKALVLFVRPATRGDDVQAVVYEGEQFIGVVSSDTVVSYHADPGPHRFMVISEAADFIDAEKKKAAYEPKWLQKRARPLLRLEDGTEPAGE